MMSRRTPGGRSHLPGAQGTQDVPASLPTPNVADITASSLASMALPNITNLTSIAASGISKDDGCSQGIAEARQYCGLENAHEDCTTRCQRSLENVKNCTAAQSNPDFTVFYKKCHIIETNVNSGSVICGRLVFAATLSVLGAVTATGFGQYL
ncbi:hypothetical protein CBR_g22331 [Chara braunii]|uniref:Uncharacterized protein n=1 Tax=Chara braunii TaxID=69332 RepID=A0A388JUQ1_CHABU|nr:hypothetical protein CBR_g22331 [Chara braunii]|eukprot:GBG61534.1 hypothetical protein CBR_g22331 [Chara braunii]